MRIKFNVEYALGFCRLCNSIALINNTFSRLGMRAACQGAKKDKAKLLAHFEELSNAEKEELLVASFQCAYAMSPMLHADISLEAMLAEDGSEWN